MRNERLGTLFSPPQVMQVKRGEERRKGQRGQRGWGLSGARASLRRASPPPPPPPHWPPHHHTCCSRFLRDMMRESAARGLVACVDRRAGACVWHVWRRPNVKVVKVRATIEEQARRRGCRWASVASVAELGHRLSRALVRFARPRGNACQAKISCVDDGMHGMGCFRVVHPRR